jgi:hypothetical protein
LGGAHLARDNRGIGARAAGGHSGALRWKNYFDVFAAIPFAGMFLNSALMTIGRTAGTRLS